MQNYAFFLSYPKKTTKRMYIIAYLYYFCIIIRLTKAIYD